MHVYATNIPSPNRLMFMLVVAAIALASVLSVVSGFLADWIGITAAVGSVSAMAVYLFLWWLFDNHLWKHPLARRVLLVPDLNGAWTCTGRTITQGSEKVDYKWNATITITQSWSKMLIRLEATQSSSISIAASLYHEGDKRYRLIYHYANDPKPSEPVLRRHAGLTNLLFDAAVERASGQYFTDGDRMTVGEMDLVRNGEDNGPTDKA